MPLSITDAAAPIPAPAAMDLTTLFGTLTDLPHGVQESLVSSSLNPEINFLSINTLNSYILV